MAVRNGTRKILLNKFGLYDVFLDGCLCMICLSIEGERSGTTRKVPRSVVVHFVVYIFIPPGSVSSRPRNYSCEFTLLCVPPFIHSLISPSNRPIFRPFCPPHLIIAILNAPINASAVTVLAPHLMMTMASFD